MLPELVFDLGPNALIDLFLSVVGCDTLVLQIIREWPHLRGLPDIRWVEESRVDWKFKLLAVIIVFLAKRVFHISNEGWKLIFFWLIWLIHYFWLDQWSAGMESIWPIAFLHIYSFIMLRFHRAIRAGGSLEVSPTPIRWRRIKWLTLCSMMMTSD